VSKRDGNIPLVPHFNPITEKWNGWMGQPTYRLEKKMRAENVAWAYEKLLSEGIEKIREYAAENSEHPALIWVAANTILHAAYSGKYNHVDKMIDRVIGKVREMQHVEESERANPASNFVEFCTRAGYPEPFAKQIEMMIFGTRTPGIKLLLGSRGYGKTDYVVILGFAWSIFLDPTMTILLITKSDTKNKGIVGEIERVLRANGVGFDVASTSELRVRGLTGKEPSLSAITNGSKSVRGRHPRKVVMDDPVTEEDTSETTRNQVQKLYFELCKVCNDILIIGQPVHKFDLYEYLRPKLKQVMEVPHGVIPELDHDLEAQRIAGVSEESISASYHLKVLSENGSPFEKINSIDRFPPGSCVAFIDPSFEGGDTTAISVIKGHFDGVVVYGCAWKRAWFDLIDEFQEIITSKGVERLCFETNSLGEQPIILLRSLIEGCGIVGKKSLGSKHGRIMAAAPYAPMIFLAEDSNTSYKDQVRKYEYGAKVDDGPDSLATGLEWIGLIRGPGTR
jgi:hypothetical protein